MAKRGQKECPKCKKTLGARTLICPGCKYDFYGKKEKTPVKEKEVKIEKIRPIVQDTEDAPSYVAPIKLSPKEHAKRVLSYGESRARHLLDHARHEHCWGHVDWKEVESKLS